MKLIKKYLPFFALFVFILFVTYPLFTSGYIPTHDGEYHIIRFIEFKKVIESGTLIPRWAPDMNNGYGIPLFSFFYPFPNYVGTVLQWLGIDAVRAFFVSLALAYALAVVSVYLLFRKKSSAVLSFAGAVIFGTVPYLFVDMYVRGSIGEVWAIGWIMAALAFLTWKNPLGIALSTFLLIISHNILAMFFLPVLGILLILKKPTYCLWLLLSLGLSAYFWIPVLLERSFVAGLNMISFRDHFSTLADLLIPSWGTGFSGMGITGDRMSTQLGLIPILISALGFFFLLKWKIKKTAFWFFFLLFSITPFLLLDVSLPLWDKLPFLQLAQYPWRFLSYTVISIPFLLNIFMNKKPRFVLVLAILSIVFTYTYMRPVHYPTRNTSYYLGKTDFMSGTSSLGNSFSTLNNPWRKEKPLEEVQIVDGTGIVKELDKKLLMDSLVVESTTGATIRINRSYYPGWMVRVNGNTSELSGNTEGTIDLTVFPGTSSITVWLGTTPVRSIANAISLASFFIVGVILYYSYDKNWV
jgi:hypothetical protein